MTANQAQKAFDLLAPLEIQRAGDADYDLALGLAANQVGQFARAIFALERVLASQSDNAQARAELARALFGVGDNANARKLLLETKSQGVPQGVGRTIDEFLQAIEKVDEAGRSKFRLRLDMGLGYDTNVNSGPSQTSFAVPALGGLVFNLQPAGVKKAASYAQLGIGGNGRMVLAPRWSLIGNAFLSTRKHGNDASPFNVDQLDASGGVAYREERQEISGALNYGHTSIGNNTLRKLMGGTGEWTYRPDGTRQWGSYLQLADLQYPSQPARDGMRRVIGTSYSEQVRNSLIYYAGGYVGQETVKDARFPHLGNKFVGLRAGLQMPISPQLSVFGSASVEARRHGAVDPLFLVTRRDTQLDLTVGASWAFSDRWSLKPQLSLNNNASNIVISDSKKTSLSVISRYEF